MDKEQNKQFYISERKIQKCHEVYQIKNLAQQLNESDLSEEEKKKFFILLDKRLKIIREKQKQRDKKKKQEKTQMSFYFSSKEIQILENYQKQAKEKLGKDYTINQIAKLKITQQDFDIGWLEQEQQKLDLEQQKQQIIQNTLQIFRNIGTNINKMTHKFNEEVKFFGRKHGITKQETEVLLNRVDELENKVLEFIKTNLKDI